MDIYDFTDWDEFERAVTSPRPGEQAKIRRWFHDPAALLPNGKLDPKRAAENGLIHYHAWTQDVLVDVLKYLGMHIEVVVEDVPERHDSFLIVASKPVSQE